MTDTNDAGYHMHKHLHFGYAVAGGESPSMGVAGADDRSNLDSHYCRHHGHHYRGRRGPHRHCRCPHGYGSRHRRCRSHLPKYIKTPTPADVPSTETPPQNPNELNVPQPDASAGDGSSSSSSSGPSLPVSPGGSNLAQRSIIDDVYHEYVFFSIR